MPDLRGEVRSAWPGQACSGCPGAWSLLARGQRFHTRGPVDLCGKSMLGKGLETTRRGHLATLGGRLGCGRGEACLLVRGSPSAVWTQGGPAQHGLALGKFGVHTGPPRGCGPRIWTCQTQDPWDVLAALSPGTDVGDLPCTLRGPGSLPPHRVRRSATPQLLQGGPVEPCEPPWPWPALWDPTAGQSG